MKVSDPSNWFSLLENLAKTFVQASIGLFHYDSVSGTLLMLDGKGTKSHLSQIRFKLFRKWEEKLE